MTTLCVRACREPREFVYSTAIALLLHGAVVLALLSVLPAARRVHPFDLGFEMVTLPPQAVVEPQAQAAPQPEPARPSRAEPTPGLIEPVKQPRKAAVVRETPPVPVPAKPAETEAPPTVTQAGPATTTRQVQPTIESVTPPNANVAYLRNPLPSYPRVARRRHIEGTVVLFVAVSAEGRPTQVRVESSSGFDLLDRAALDAVNRWRFEPARRNGVAAAGQVLVPVRFKLENG